MSYYVQHNGQQLGPFTEAEVRAQLASGAISASDHVWWEGQKDWLPLQTTPLVVSAGTPPAVVAGTPAAAAYQPPSALRPTSQLAIWALVCGCVSFFCWIFASIAAVVLGHMALSDLKKNPAQEGRGMAIAGLVLGYLTMAFGLIYLGILGISVLIALGNQVRNGG
jgi:hypothetical protein